MPPEYDPSLETVDQDFCSCTDASLSTSVCGAQATEDSALLVALPSEDMIDFIPSWIWQLFGRRKRRDTGENTANELTDEVVEDYEVDNVEENSLNPIAEWPTWNNITEEQARLYCDQFLRNSTPAVCKDFVTEDDLSVVVHKCMNDIQVTGDLAWAADKINDINTLCVQNALSGNGNTTSANSTLEGIHSLMEEIAASICLEQCSGVGTCENSICQCEPGYSGGDCSVADGEPPDPIEFMSPVICNIQERLCESVRILADKLVNSETLTCRLEAEQMDGTRYTEDSVGEVISYNEVQCPLASLYTIDAGSGPAPFYRYNISLSNDGVVFSSPLSPPNSQMGAVVYDAECIVCSEEAGCSQADGTCLITGRCYLEGDTKPNYTCEACEPDVDPYNWVALSDNQAPVLDITTFSKAEGSILRTQLEGTDTEGHTIFYELMTNTSESVNISDSGILEWHPPDDPDAKFSMDVRMEDECGAVNEVTLELTLKCLDCVTPGLFCWSSPCVHGACVELGTSYRCECNDGYEGPNCDVDINHCLVDPCIHGVCRDGVLNHMCVCDSGYTGFLCERPVTPCDPNPCHNAPCHVIAETGFECECRPFYEGSTCRDYIDEGTWGEWYMASGCSKECDYGITARHRVCKRGECHGSDREDALCNTFNCEEQEDEHDEGVVLAIHDMSVEEVVFESDDIHRVTASLVDEFCNADMELCCQALRHRYTMQDHNRRFISAGDVSTASGFPRLDEVNAVVKLKLLVTKTTDELLVVCGEGDTGNRKKRSESQGDREQLFDQNLLHEILNEGQSSFQESLGFRVDVVDTAPTESDDVRTVVIIGSVLGGVVLIVLLVVIIVVVIIPKSKSVRSGYTRKMSGASRRRICVSPASSEGSPRYADSDKLVTRPGNDSSRCSLASIGFSEQGHRSDQLAAGFVNSQFIPTSGDDRTTPVLVNVGLGSALWMQGDGSRMPSRASTMTMPDL